MNNKSSDYGLSGLTLVEVMVAVFFIGILFVSFASMTGQFSKGVFLTKSGTLANILAQEKIETLKNISYYRLMVTKEEDLYAPGPGYDQSYYPPETLIAGDIRFERRVVVYRMEEVDGNLKIVTSPDSSPDTDLKLVKVTALWMQGADEKSLVIENLRENPSRVALDAKIWGYVTSTGTIFWGGTISGYNDSTDSPPADRARLGSAKVYVVENPAYETYTETDGRYELKIPTGTWKLYVSKWGSWDYETPSITVAKSQTKKANVQLQEKLKGKVTGYAVFSDRILISQVVASTISPFGYAQEYMELYNPTTWQWTITDATFDLKIQTKGPGSRPAENILDVPLIFVNNSIQPNGGYYLIASTHTVIIAGDSVTADAYYDEPALAAQGLILDLIEKDRAGAVVIADDYGVAIGSVGWNRINSPAANPSQGWYERSYISSPNGVEEGYTFMRGAYMRGSRGWVSYSHGNAYDEKWNQYDYYVTQGAYSLITSTTMPRNTSAVIAPKGGSPAMGAIVTADDGLSTGYSIPPTLWTGYFEMTMATGTWTVMISTRQFFMQVSSVNVRAGQTTGIPNNQTDPAWSPWPAQTTPCVRLTSPTVCGYVTGTIGLNISGIKVDGTSSLFPAFTDSSGRYRLNLSISGTTYIDATITVNPYPDSGHNPNYSTERGTATVYLGQITTRNFNLAQAGKITGLVSTSSINPQGSPLPNMVVKATKGTLVRTEVTGSDGIFWFLNVATGTWTIGPVLDSGEGSTPSSVEETLTIGDSVSVGTFVVSGAMGKFYGNIRDSRDNDLIKSGVLIIATTSTIDADNPPVINDALRNSGRALYCGVTHGDGSYEIPVRAGSYRLYLWFTEASRVAITVHKKTYSGPYAVSAGGSYELDMEIP